MGHPHRSPGSTHQTEIQLKSIQQDKKELSCCIGEAWLNARRVVKENIFITSFCDSSGNRLVFFLPKRNYLQKMWSKNETTIVLYCLCGSCDPCLYYHSGQLCRHYYFYSRNIGGARKRIRGCLNSLGIIAWDWNQTSPAVSEPASCMEDLMEMIWSFNKNCPSSEWTYAADLTPLLFLAL